MRIASTWLPPAALIVVTWAILLWSPNFRWTDEVRARSFGGDALQEWLGSSVARNDPDRLYDLDTIIALQHDADFVGYRFQSDAYFPMVYPPFYYVALRPLSYGSARQAAYALLFGGVLSARSRFLAAGSSANSSARGAVRGGCFGAGSALRSAAQ